MKTLNYSVVIPTFNSTNTIFNTINSITNQTIEPEEIIVVDDCSDDIKKLKELCLSFESHNIKIIEKSSKSNAANSRNIGWKMAKSHYVFFLDSDDVWLPNHAENVLEIFKNEKSQCVYGSFTVNFGDIQIDHNLLSVNELTVNKSDFIFKLKNDFRTSTIAVSKKLYEIASFDDFADKHQDWDLFLNLVLNNVYISHNSNLDVVINSHGAHRMSNANNINATNIFVNKWLFFIGADNARRMWRSCLLKGISSNNLPDILKIEKCLKDNDLYSLLMRLIIALFKFNPVIVSYSFNKIKLLKRMHGNKKITLALKIKPSDKKR